MSLAQATTVRSLGGGRFEAEVAEGWDIGGNANGGYLLSIVGRAVTEATGRPDVVTITGHYLAPGKPGPARVEVDVLRAGGRHATASAVLESGGRPALAVVATMTDLDDASGPEQIDAAAPDLPRPEDCIAFEPADGAGPPSFAGQVEMRLHPDDAAFAQGRPSGRARMRGWFRLRDGEIPDSIALVLATDAFPPTIFNADLPVAWTPTIELTAHVRAHAPAGWWRCAFVTRFISGGYLEADGEIWDEAGHLLAESRQLALVPRG